MQWLAPAAPPPIKDAVTVLPSNEATRNKRGAAGAHRTELMHQPTARAPTAEQQ